MNRIAQIGIPGDLDQVVDTKAITVWDFVWAVVIIALSFLIAALTRRLVGRLLRKFPDIPQNYKLLMASASGWFVIVIGIIYALGVLGVDLGPALIGLLLVAGVAFFAGRGILENFTWISNFSSIETAGSLSCSRSSLRRSAYFSIRRARR